MSKHTNLALFSAIAVALSSLSQSAMAEEAGVEHLPRPTAQVRLGSWWFARHAEKIAEIEEANDPKKDKKIELLMVGDSITNNFDKGGPGEPVWEEYFVPLNALNLGFGGDRTNHVLWRLDHLPVLKTAPLAASLMIGTNNICWGSDKPQAGCRLGSKRSPGSLIRCIPR